MLRLVASGIEKSFGFRPIFRAVSFEETSGLFAIRGQNGSGKSTLLKILAGLLRPSRGAARVFDGSRELSPDERRLNVGWCAPDMFFPGELSARENLALLAAAGGLSHAPVDGLLSRVGLAATSDRPVREFSSGMLQRLRLAFSVLTAPPVLLWDEPFANLDEEGLAAGAEILNERRRRGLVVLASNDSRDFDRPDASLVLS